MAINFISSKDFEETRIMHRKSNNVEMMIGSKTDKIMEDLFETFFAKISRKLRRINERNEFVYDSVDILYYNLNKVSLSRGGSYIDSPK